LRVKKNRGHGPEAELLERGIKGKMKRLAGTRGKVTIGTKIAKPAVGGGRAVDKNWGGVGKKKKNATKVLLKKKRL